jgi:hypothetical protein
MEFPTVTTNTNPKNNSISLDSKSDLVNLGVDKLKELIKAKLENIDKLEKGRADLFQRLKNITIKEKTVQDSYFSKIDLATDNIQEDKDALPKLYEALKVCYIKQCSEQVLINPKEALAELARLQLTNCGIGDNVISDKFEISKEVDFKQLADLIKNLASQLEGQKEVLSKLCLELAKVHHDATTSHYHHMGLSADNYPYHEKFAIFFYSLASQLDPSLAVEVSNPLLNYYCSFTQNEPKACFERAKLFYEFRKSFIISPPPKHDYENCFNAMMASNDANLMEDYANWILKRNIKPGNDRVEEAAALRERAKELRLNQNLT